MCIPVLATTLPEWLRGTEPLPHTPGAVRPRCFCSVLHAHAGLIRRTPPPTFSDTAVTDRHSDTTIFQLSAHWVRISWSIGSENRSDMCPRWESNPRLPACKASTLSTRSGSLLPVTPLGYEALSVTENSYRKSEEPQQHSELTTGLLI